METKKFTMWTKNKERFEKKIRHLNKILKRHGKPAFRFHYENERLEAVTFEEHVKGDAWANDEFSDFMVGVCDVVVEGDLLVKKDDREYRYVGSVSFDEGVKVTHCKDEKFADAFINFRDGICDHCGTKRMNRKSYYLFEVDGKVLQIGSTCVKEYLGIDSMEYLKCMESTLIVIDECGEEDPEACWAGKPSFSDSVGLSFNLLYKFVDFATMGFTKWTKAADGIDSSDFARFRNTCDLKIHQLATMEIVTDEIYARCRGKKYHVGKNEVSLTREQCLEYWQSQPLTLFTDNMVNALKAAGATRRTLGLYCYAIYGAVNAFLKARMAKESDTSKPCKYEIGQRVNIRGRVLSVSEFEVENAFVWHGGLVTKYSVNFRDEDDALYHFTTSGKTFMDVKEGDEVEIRGKIEPAKEYKGVMYTRLGLPKVVRVLAKAKAECA